MSKRKKTTSGDEITEAGIRTAKQFREQNGDCTNPLAMVNCESDEDNDVANKSNRNSKEQFSVEFPEKFIRIFCMCVDLGTDIIFKAFLFYINDDIEAFLTSKQNVEKLKELKRNHILTAKEFELVTCRNPRPQNFDISLLVKLMRNLLPANTLEPPQSGWERYPGQNDQTVAADLLRLRKIRNKIIAHSSKCHISKSCFEKEWHITAAIVIRITSKIMPDKTEAIKEKIFAYERNPIDNGMFTQLLEKCQEELKEIQKKVAELFKTLNGFEVYFETRPGRYESYMKLLLEGGQYVLRKILERELQRQGTDLGSMLSKYKHDLLENIHNPAHKEVLFPSNIKLNAEINSVTQWDILILATFVLTVFDKELSQNEKGEIKRIQVSMENYADAAISSLDGEQFLHCWTDLTRRISSLAMVLDEEVKEHCDDLIDKCQGQVGCDADIDKLQTMCAGMKTLKDIYKEQVAELKQTLREMQDIDIPLREPLKLELKFITLGNNKEKTKIAEDILLTVWQEALSQTEDSTSFDEVRKAVQEILDSIRSKPGVTDISVTQRCVVISIISSSYESMLHLLEYVFDYSFQQCIDNIVEELRFVLDEVLIMTAALTLESLHDLKAVLQRRNDGDINEVSTGNVCVPITFSSVNGMKKVWSYLKSNEFSDAANEMTSALMQRKTELDIHVRTNIDSFSKLFEETEPDLSSLESMSSEDTQAFGENNAFRNENAQRDWLKKEEGVKLNMKSAKTDTHNVENDKGNRHDITTGTDLHQAQISIGDSIRPYARGSCGTVGPFVRIRETGEMCFLTVRHIFGRLTRTDEDVKGTKVHHRLSTHRSAKSKERICGEVIACEYSEDLDAAVVKLSQDHIPNRSRFTSVVDEMCHNTDSSKMRTLKYANIQSSIKAKDLNSEERTKMRLVKIGSSTGLTEGSFVLDQSKENISTENATVLWKHPKKELWEAVPYQNHIHVKNIYNETFAKEDDAGAAVYLVDENNYLHCIGILCREMNENQGFLVCPIETVLNRLGEKAGCTFDVDKYEQLADTIDPYEEEAFDRVLREEERDRHIRINIIGFFAEGKTTLTRRLLHESLEDSYGTDGIDVHVKKCKVKGKQWTQCKALDLYEECAKRLVDAVGLECENVTKADEMDHQTKNGEKHFPSDDFLREQIKNKIPENSSKSLQYSKGKSSSEPSYFLNGIEVKNKSLNLNLPETLRDVSHRPDRCDEDEIYHQSTNGDRHFHQNGFVTEHTNQQKYTTISSESFQYIKSASSSYSRKGIKEQSTKLIRLFSKHLRDISDETDQCEFIANIWDFGGQFIYYATHQIFHTRDAIYLLCFDLTKDLETMIIDCDFPDRREMMKNSLLFWVNSIYASVGGEDKSSENPVIILVGTHRDKFQGNIDEKFDKVFDLFTKSDLRNLIYKKPFAVASKDKNDYAIGELRNAIYELGLKRSNARLLPTKWIPLEIAVLGDTEKNILLFKDIESVNTNLTHPLSGKQEIKSFLNYHHAKGTIVFFDEEVLNKYVITKPQFLVDAFKCIITAKWFCRWNKDVRNSWKKLTNEGVLETSLLNEVWSESRESNFIEYKEILLLFLERQRILAEIQRMDETTGEITSLGKYMIPSMLTRDCDNGTILDFVRGKRYTPVILGLEIGSEVLAIVYDKVSAALLGKWPPLEYKGQILVFQNGGVFRLDLQHACMIKKTDVSIEFMVVNLCPPEEPNSIICDRFRRYVEMAITNKKIQSNGQEKSYYIKCNHTYHEGLGSRRFHYFHDISNDANVCCPDNDSHAVNVHEATASWFLEKTILPTEADAIRKATPEDKLVKRIAKEFGTNWKLLGILIGLSVDELGQIDTGKDKIIVYIVHMFECWVRKYPDLKMYNYDRKGKNYFDKKTFEGWDKFRNCFD